MFLSKKLSLAFTVPVGVFLGTVAHSQDSRDDEVFGSSNSTPAVEAAPSAAARSLVDTLQIGGRLEIRGGSGVQEQQKFTEGSYSQLRQADIYFDSRPNKDIRAFLRVRLLEEKPASVTGTTSTTTACEGCVKTQIDELWIKWDLYDQMFFTYGKQHLKWGSGKIWNPTDFTAAETRDPFALFDRRLGQELLKIHLPLEKQAFNFYGVAQFDDMSRNDRVAFGLRGEFAIAGRAELALTWYNRADQPLRYGADLSTALGPIDVYGESAISRRETRTFYEGELDPDRFMIPSERKREDQWFQQSVGGLQYSFKYSDDDSLTIGAEYLYNQLGYEDRGVELYSLLNRQSKALYAGRRYGAGYIRVPNPGSWNETSFFLTGIRNLSDETSIVRLTSAWLAFKEATVEAFVSGCQGDYGELCFRAPENIQRLVTVPGVSDEQRAIIRALPTKRTLYSTGISASMSF